MTIRPGPYPILIGDVGGTNARFALLAAPGAVPRPLPRRTTTEFPDPEAAIRASLAGCEGRPRSALLALATRIDGPVVRLTNAAWTFDAQALSDALGLERVTFVNDYVPVAAAAAVLGEGSLQRIGPEVPSDPRRPRLVVGPGTGLGAGALIPAAGRLLIQSTEAGHVEFGAMDAEERALWPHIEPAEGRVTSEALISGPGLLRLHRAVCARRDGGNACGQPSEVLEAALAGDALAAETLHLFVRFLGRFAGDLALLFAAEGGVLIGGGIAPRIMTLLNEGAFRRAFEDKAPFAQTMRQTPTFVITDPDPALTGLAVLAERPGDFIFLAEGWSR